MQLEEHDVEAIMDAIIRDGYIRIISEVFMRISPNNKTQKNILEGLKSKPLKVSEVK